MERLKTKAFWALIILAPLFAEVILGNTLAVAWLNPVVSIGQIALYGCAAVLAREINLRFKGGLVSLFALCGLTGIIIEGLSVATWFNPNFAGLGAMKGFGIYAGTNWPWVFHLQMYHAVESTFIPIITAELLFAPVAQESWLPKRPAIVLFMLGAIFVPMFRLALHFPYTPLQLGICFAGIAIVIAAGWLLRKVRVPSLELTNRSWILAAFAVIGWFVYFLFELRAFKSIPPAGLIVLTFALGIPFLFLPLASLRSEDRVSAQWAWIAGTLIFYACLCFVEIFVQSPLEIVNMTIDIVGAVVILRMLKRHRSPLIGSASPPQPA